jgi:hypothetical protein
MTSDRVTINGRTFGRGERRRAVALALAKARTRLDRSVAHVTATARQPRPEDLARWLEMRRNIAGLEAVLADLDAGLNPPGSPKTGTRLGRLAGAPGYPPAPGPGGEIHDAGKTDAES